MVNTRSALRSLPAPLFLVAALSLVGCKANAETTTPEPVTDDSGSETRDDEEESPPELEAKPSGTDSFQIPNDNLERKPSKDDRFKIPNSVVVCSWNIKWFGSKNVEVYDFVTMADFIEECDVAAIQELQDPNAKKVLAELLDELKARGYDYRYELSDLTGYKNNPTSGKNDYLERYAYIWNEASLELKGTADFADSPAINHPVFRQVPFVADFHVLNEADFDFRMLTTHTVYNKKLNQTRKAEIQWISDWVSTMPADGEQNLVAIGDFNANPSSQPSHFADIVKANPLYRIAWYESLAAGETSVRTTAPQNDSSSNPTYQTLPLYDHILVSTETSGALAEGSNPMTQQNDSFGVWEFDNDPWWKAHGWSRKEAIAAVSDHRPIWFRLKSGVRDED